ncbi:phosphonopyruvate decarboxylase [Pseudonocardiaceae bacterium YIM PH 21723]|nr:phosphonopyruvate decarboxylase [Pseudonocardiaceae bacterium YIM PH 21723]
MITAEQFCAELDALGFTGAAGVPCSFFGGPISVLEERGTGYVSAANEGAAVGVATGMVLAGGKPYVMLQNSGLGNLINPLTSLVMMYRVPLLTFVSLRGWPDPSTDEPQHEFMGPLVHPLLDQLELPHWTLRAEDGIDRFREVLAAVETELAAGGSPFVLVGKGAIGKAEAAEQTSPQLGVTSQDAVRLISRLAGDRAIIASTGFIGRELFGVDDRPRNFYMQGSMGHASAIGLGVALSRPDQVIVLDGDGAALMHLGTMSTIGHLAPPNLVHIVLDNGAHESTGGQATTSTTTSFSGVAAAAGYATAITVDTLEDIEAALQKALDCPGPHLVTVRTLPRTGAMPPRATSAAGPVQLRERFEAELGGRPA